MNGMLTICFTVLGEPMSKGSKVPGIGHTRDGKPYAYLREENADAKKLHAKGIGAAALAARTEAQVGLLRDVALAVTLRFYTASPAYRYGSGRNSHLLKDNAPARPHKKPDVDKWARHTLDAMTGVIYADDGQVVDLLCAKRYAEGDEPARIEIEVTVIEQQTVGVQMPDEQLALAA